MIRIESDGIFAWFDSLAEEACRVAKGRSRNTFFYWNASDLVEATPTSTLDELRAQLTEKERKREALKSKFRLEKRGGEEQEALVDRGLAMATDQNAKVTIVSGSTWLDLHPWTPREIAILEWQARLAD